MNWLGPALTVLIVPGVLAALAKAAKAPAKVKVQNGMAWVEYGLCFKILSFVSVMIPCGLGILWFFVNADDRLPVLMMILLFGGLGIPLFMEAFFVKIGFDDSLAYCYSPWRPSRQVRFCDMGEPYFSESMHWWVIPTQTQGRIRMHQFISGASDLLQKLQEHKNNGHGAAADADGHRS